MGANRRGFLKSLLATPIFGSVALAKKPEAVVPKPEVPKRIETTYHRGVDDDLRPGHKISISYRGMNFIGVVTEVRYDRPVGNLIRQRVEAERWIDSEMIKTGIPINCDTVENLDWHRSRNIERILFTRFIPVATSYQLW